MPAATLVPDSILVLVSLGINTWNNFESGWIILTLRENLSLFLSLKTYIKNEKLFLWFARAHSRWTGWREELLRTVVNQYWQMIQYWLNSRQDLKTKWFLVFKEPTRKTHYQSIVAWQVVWALTWMRLSFVPSWCNLKIITKISFKIKIKLFESSYNHYI